MAMLNFALLSNPPFPLSRPPQPRRRRMPPIPILCLATAAALHHCLLARKSFSGLTPLQGFVKPPALELTHDDFRRLHFN
jgi:hypothetical protein